MDAKRVAGFVFLLGAAAGSYYLSRSMSETETEIGATPTIQGGFYLRSARFLGTGADGRPLYEVEADYAEQRGDELIEFQNVQVVYSPESGVPWTLTADSAVITHDQRLLMLEGHVVATTAQGLAGEETEIRTPYLELEPSNYRAETNDRVQIRIGSRSLTATGMLASLKDDRVTLKSNVSGKFVP